MVEVERGGFYSLKQDNNKKQQNWRYDNDATRSMALFGLLIAWKSFYVKDLKTYNSRQS